MISFLRGIGVVQSSHHDRLVREKVRLSEERDSILKYTEILRKLRLSLQEAYQETKGWRFPWTRYELMEGLVTNVLEAYEKVRASQQKDQRDATLARMGIGDKVQDESSANVKMDCNDMTTTELESALQNVKLETTKAHEQYRQESAIFNNLQREFQSLQKYGLFQRFIILKLLIKIAGKADL